MTRATRSSGGCGNCRPSSCLGGPWTGGRSCDLARRDPPWPQQLETDRAQVGDPDSIGVHITGCSDAELLVVLFRGGWADVDFAMSDGIAVVSEAPGVREARAFGNLLDDCVIRAFGRGPDTVT